MREIYADFNNIENDGALPLTCVGSVASIAALKEPPGHGEEVWFSDGELRVQGRIYQTSDGSWEGRSDWHFLK
jgi:hypothetical protein